MVTGWRHAPAPSKRGRGSLEARMMARPSPKPPLIVLICQRDRGYVASMISNSLSAEATGNQSATKRSKICKEFLCLLCTEYRVRQRHHVGAAAAWASSPSHAPSSINNRPRQDARAEQVSFVETASLAVMRKTVRKISHTPKQSRIWSKTAPPLLSYERTRVPGYAKDWLFFLHVNFGVDLGL